MSEDNVLLTPDEVKKRRERKQETKIEQEKKEDTKFYNRGGTVAVNFESQGRFSIPETLFFKDYSVEDVNNLTLSRQEDILENILSIMEHLKNEDAKCKIADMTIEEFLESLIGIKKQFNTTQHVHRWICNNCQSDVDEEDRVVNETVIDLNNIQYKSIEEADEILREYYKKQFEMATDEDWKNYLFTRYKNDPIINIDEYTRDEEVSKIKIKEPISINPDGHIYEFRLTRIGDVVEAQKIAAKKYGGKIKNVQNRKEANSPLAQLKEKKKEEIDDLKYEQGKYTLLVAKALSLISVDGKELNNEEKIATYSKLSRNTYLEINDFINQFKFGICHEQEFTCSVCGKVDKRWLRQELNPLDLLPLDTDTTRNSRKSSAINICVGL